MKLATFYEKFGTLYTRNITGDIEVIRHYNFLNSRMSGDYQLPAEPLLRIMGCR